MNLFEAKCIQWNGGLTGIWRTFKMEVFIESLPNQLFVGERQGTSTFQSSRLQKQKK